jgi:hypothetical protein
MGSENPFTGSEPARSVSKRAARRAVSSWMSRKTRNSGSLHQDKIVQRVSF